MCIDVGNIAKELDKYRSNNGIQWKRKFKELIFNGRNNEPYIQQFRNNFDFDTLDKIKYVTTVEEIKIILNKNRDK